MSEVWYTGGCPLRQRYQSAKQAISGLSYANECPDYPNPYLLPPGNRVERSHRTLGASLRSDDSTNPGSWPIKLNTILSELNNARNRMTGVSPFFGMFGRNPRLPLDVCFPTQNIQKSNNWTKYVENLSGRFEEIHEHMRKHELLTIPMDQGIKSPRGLNFIKLGDLVYQFSPRAIVNLSRKLTLRWIGPYRVVEIISPSLCTIFPIGEWCTVKKEVKTLTSRLRKVDPTYSQPLGDMIDQDPLTEDLSEGEDIILQSPQPHLNVDLNEDVEEESEIEVGSEEEGDVPFVPPPLLSEGVPADPLINPTSMENYSPQDIKLEPRSPTPVLSENIDIANDVPDIPVELPKQKRVRKPLPPPREKGATRPAFDEALKTLSGTLKRKK